MEFLANKLLDKKKKPQHYMQMTHKSLSSRISCSRNVNRNWTQPKYTFTLKFLLIVTICLPFTLPICMHDPRATATDMIMVRIPTQYTHNKTLAKSFLKRGMLT
jgi:hypothetical protein